MSDFAKLRERMVSEQIHARGVRDDRVLEAMRRVHREAFVPANVREYDNATSKPSTMRTEFQSSFLGLINLSVVRCGLKPRRQFWQRI